MIKSFKYIHNIVYCILSGFSRNKIATYRAKFFNGDEIQHSTREVAILSLLNTLKIQYMIL